MEKTIKIGLIFFLSCLSACMLRTPENILKLQFNVSLKGFDYKVETFEEQWYPNGDGHVYIVFKFKKLTESNIKYFQSLGFKEFPITGKNLIPDRFLCKKGYYLFERESDDNMDFKFFVVDTEKNKAILYYEYL